MAEVQFYHLLTTPLERALPKLMEKAYASGHKSLVRVSSEAEAERLTDALWNDRSDSFLPHGSAKDPHPELQPIFITPRPENPNGSDILVITDGSLPEHVKGFFKILDLFDGHDEAAVANARVRWKSYSAAGHTVKYNKQQTGGGWKQMA
jgi:DNA polymerase-3 subunit chi